MSKTVYLHEEKNHHKLVLNRPEKLNAFSPQLVTEFHDTLQTLTAQEPKILLIKGAGTSFSSGHDVETVISVDNFADLKNQLVMLQEITSMIVNYPAPVIAAVNGYALGAGCEIALNCDFIYAAEDATFGFPELDIGLSITQGSSYFLQKLVGPLKAKELVLFRQRISAIEAQKIGLINEVVEHDHLFDHVNEKISNLADVNMNALIKLKKLFQFSGESTLQESMNKEVETLISLLS